MPDNALKTIADLEKLTAFYSEPFIRKKLEAYQQLSQGHSPSNSIYFKMADCQRALGHYENACKSYQKSAELDHLSLESDYLADILAQHPIDQKNTPNGCLPSPFVIRDNFLNSHESSLIWALYKQNSPNIKQSKVGKNTARSATLNSTNKTYSAIDKNIRNSTFLDLPNIADQLAFFNNKLRPEIAATYQQFGIKPPAKEHTAFQITSYHDGAFFKIHKDTGPTHVDRILTFVYYFFVEPKVFSGGDLLLHDTDHTTDSYSLKFTKILPKNNRLVIFPSNYFHQVSPVKTNNDIKLDSRHSISGWHSRAL